MMDTEPIEEGMGIFYNGRIAFYGQLVTHVGLLSFLFLMLVACPLRGQVTSKKVLTPKDYHRWSTLGGLQISNNGKWASYSKQYDYGEDTLFIKSTANGPQYVFPGNGKLEFTANGRTAIIKLKSNLIIQDLYTGEANQINACSGYEVVQEGKYLLVQKENGSNNSFDLFIKSMNSERQFFLSGIQQYVMDPMGRKLLYTVQDNKSVNLLLLDLTNKNWEPMVLRESPSPFKQLIWGPSGNSFAFLQFKDSGSRDLNIHFYKFRPVSQWYKLDAFGSSFGNGSFQLSNSRLIISNDDQKVFFRTLPIPKDSLIGNQIVDELVEIWHVKDKLIYPRKQFLGLESPQKITWAWWPNTDKKLQLGTTDHPYNVLTPNFDYAISFNLWDNEPQFKRDSEPDFYIRNIGTGKKGLLMDKLPTQVKYFTMSVDGEYLKYFKNGDWWAYNFNKGEHTNLTKDMEAELFYFDFGQKDAVVAYGSPGWMLDENSILIYDKYDLWQISLDGRKKERLTHGKEKRIKYRIYEKGKIKPRDQLFPAFRDNNFNIDQNLVIEGRGNDLSSGFFQFNFKMGMRTLAYGPKKIYDLRKAENTDHYIYLEETFEEPTQLINLRVGNAPEVLAEPNFFQREYAWGKSSLIAYKNTEGVDLRGVLIYPSNYTPENNYPMIVNIYEVQHQKLYRGVIPSEFKNSEYLNPSIFASKGYFVFYPDISYVIGKPGKSALDCVVSGVNKVISMNLVDPQRIGLIGTSFGGYETNYIISQTNIFATAISGVAPNDLIRSYLSVSEDYGLSGAWRFEHHQMRMGKSFTDDFENFMDNSPIHHVASINTPLLGWTGKEDRNVHWTQSVEMYLALRRLQKEHILLVYPGEKHVIMDKEKQKDLAKRMEEWFDHYLKGHPKKPWMLNNQFGFN